MGFHYGRFSPHKLIPSKSADNEIQTQTERPCFLIPSIPSCMLCIIYTTHKAYPSINMLKQKKNILEIKHLQSQCSCNCISVILNLCAPKCSTFFYIKNEVFLCLWKCLVCLYFNKYVSFVSQLSFAIHVCGLNNILLKALSPIKSNILILHT